MPFSRLSNINTWIFDLDNTLYPPSARLFDQIEILMTRFVMNALEVDHATADHLRDHYWKTHGTTLAGLMREHGVDPGPYLDEVHEISLENLDPAPDLRTQIARLPGRKIVYTNGPRTHAANVTRARGLDGVFDALYGIEHADFLPKPERSAFERILDLGQIDPTQSAMFEDDPRNLLAPGELGMACILVSAEKPVQTGHIHFQTDDLTKFLSRIPVAPFSAL